MTLFPRLRYYLSYLLWPFLLGLGITITAIGFAKGQEILFFNMAYALVIISLLVLERLMPHERVWNEPDGQTGANIAHTILNKGFVQGLVSFAGVVGLTHLLTPMSEASDGGLWPRTWPLWGQVMLGLMAAEFMLYWKHRLAHEWYPLWRFHAIHHSVTRLWVVNTGRFHFVDSLTGVLSAMTILILLGAPVEVVVWVSAVTAFIGVLTHCNVEMRFGVISRAFNTPELHRWHHSQDLREGNKNYGENLVLWDQIFGTYFRDETRRPPIDIGIPEPMPAPFLQQLIWPFKTFKKQGK
ncbi:MAG: sterol desaturase family protein [Alphaproteobacteria bacterium]|nr:sterol desaturase family protein [Alphaproteobacteria bacterium]